MDWTCISCIGRQDLYHWATWDAIVRLCLVAQLCPTLCDTMGCSLPGFSVHGDAPGKNTGMDSHALHQRIFPTQGSNPGLPHCRWILYNPSHHGGPIVRIAELKRRVNSRPIAECRLKSGPCKGKDETLRPRVMGISGRILCKLQADKITSVSWTHRSGVLDPSRVQWLP